MKENAPIPEETGIGGKLEMKLELGEDKQPRVGKEYRVIATVSDLDLTNYFGKKDASIILSTSGSVDEEDRDWHKPIHVETKDPQVAFTVKAVKVGSGWVGVELHMDGHWLGHITQNVEVVE
jgi:hypothetical protein